MTHPEQTSSDFSPLDDSERSLSRLATSAGILVMVTALVLAAVYIARNGIPFH